MAIITKRIIDDTYIQTTLLCHLIEMMVVKLQPLDKLTPEHVDEGLPLLLRLMVGVKLMVMIIFETFIISDLG